MSVEKIIIPDDFSRFSICLTLRIVISLIVLIHRRNDKSYARCMRHDDEFKKCYFNLDIIIRNENTHIL